MSQLNYVLEKISNAVYHLATKPEDVRGRLRYVLKYILIIHPNSLPLEFRDDFKWIKNALTKYNDSDDIYKTLRKIRNKTGSKIAERIVALEDKLINYSE